MATGEGLRRSDLKTGSAQPSSFFIADGRLFPAWPEARDPSRPVRSKPSLRGVYNPRCLTSSQAQHGAPEKDEGAPVVGLPPPAACQPPYRARVREGPLHDPAVASDAPEGVDPPARDAVEHAPRAARLPAEGVAVGRVRVELGGAAPRVAARSPHGANPVEQGREEEAVVAVARRDEARERRAPSIHDQVELGRASTSVGGRGTDRVASFWRARSSSRARRGASRARPSLPGAASWRRSPRLPVAEPSPAGHAAGAEALGHVAPRTIRAQDEEDPRQAGAIVRGGVAASRTPHARRRQRLQRAPGKSSASRSVTSLSTARRKASNDLLALARAVHPSILSQCRGGSPERGRAPVSPVGGDGALFPVGPSRGVRSFDLELSRDGVHPASATP